MGYTHYWSNDVEIPSEAWIKITEAAKLLTKKSPVKLSFEGGDRKPVQIDAETIRFNAFSEDQAYETFLLSRKPASFSFCKTAQRQYDAVVCAILAVAEEQAGDIISVRSDGRVKDWEAPVAWASCVLGRKIEIPASVRANA